MPMPDATAELSRSYDALLSRSTLSDDALAFGADRALESLDTFTDWLGAECMSTPAVDPGYVPGPAAPQHYRDAFADRMREHFTPPMLLAMALGSSTWVALAMEVLKERYLAANQDFVRRLAGEIE
jgi:hypothetical protein